MVRHEWNLKIQEIQSFARKTFEDGFTVNRKDFFLDPINVRLTSTSIFDVKNSIFTKA
jgi:hypothetical protein